MSPCGRLVRALCAFWITSTLVKFPCRVSGKLSLYIRGRIAILEAMPPPRRPGKVRGISLASEANTMPSSSSQVPVPVIRILCMLAAQLRIRRKATGTKAHNNLKVR